MGKRSDSSRGKRGGEPARPALVNDQGVLIADCYGNACIWDEIAALDQHAPLHASSWRVEYAVFMHGRGHDVAAELAAAGYRLLDYGKLWHACLKFHQVDIGRDKWRSAGLQAVRGGFQPARQLAVKRERR